MRFEWESYRTQSAKNRLAAESLGGWAVPVVEAMVNSIQRTASDLGTTFDPTGHSHAGLAVFAQLVSRAAIWSLDRLLGCQSMLAWLAVRPGIEAALVVGKFRDNVGNARIWSSRHDSKSALQEYRSTFSGKALISSSLPRSEELQSVLSRINTYFVHPNPEYLASQTGLTNVGRGVLTSVNFLDGDEELLESHILALVNLQAVLHESLCLCIRRGLGIVESGLHYDPSPILKERRSRASALAASNDPAASVLQELGLWSFEDAAL